MLLIPRDKPFPVCRYCGELLDLYVLEHPDDKQDYFNWLNA